MLRVQPSDQLGALEKETLANMERDGIRQTQFVKTLEADRQRARDLGWDAKLLDFGIPEESSKTFEAVLDSLAGFMRCSDACNYFYKTAAAQGVTFKFGPETGAFDSLIEEPVGSASQKRATGLKTKDGSIHKFDVVVIAGESPIFTGRFSLIVLDAGSDIAGLQAGSFSTQLLPDLTYHLESSGGSLAMFKIDKEDTALWNKYSPERFPVITWKSAPRNKDGTDTGSVYVLPRTPDGLVKIGYRGIKVTTLLLTTPTMSNYRHISLPTSKRLPTMQASTRTACGPFPCHLMSRPKSRKMLHMPLGNLYPYSSRILTRQSFTRPRCAGIQTL